LRNLNFHALRGLLKALLLDRDFVFADANVAHCKQAFPICRCRLLGRSREVCDGDRGIPSARHQHLPHPAIHTAAGKADASARIATTAIAALVSIVIVVVVVRLLALEVDGVDDRVGALGGLDGLGERLLASAIVAVGEDDDRLAALLFGHQLVGGDEDGIVEGRSASVAAAA